MAKKASRSEKAVLRYPKHQFTPADVLDFIQLKSFASDWKVLKLDKNDLAALRIIIMCAPSGPPVVKGTGGLRKIRFSPPASHRGKSAGVRVCYALYQEHSIVLLVMAYGKNRKENLTAAEKNEIRAMLQEIKKELDLGPIE